MGFEYQFDTWLRENSNAHHCEHYLSGLCSIEDEVIASINEIVPIASFCCDGEAKAERCDKWSADSNWFNDMLRHYQSMQTDADSYRREQAAVRAAKGFE